MKPYRQWIGPILLVTPFVVLGPRAWASLASDAQAMFAGIALALLVSIFIASIFARRRTV